jgi:hypothetical protein
MIPEQRELSLITFRYVDSHKPNMLPWHAESQKFKYLHPANGSEQSLYFSASAATEEEARSKTQAHIDWFMADRGNTIFEILDFTPHQLQRSAS